MRKGWRFLIRGRAGEIGHSIPPRSAAGDESRGIERAECEGLATGGAVDEPDFLPVIGEEDRVLPEDASAAHRMHPDLPWLPGRHP